MVSLDCNVTSCIYNEKSCCCKESIQIGGSNAHSEEGTKCQSYAKRLPDSDSVKNCACGCGTPKHRTEVSCSACNCVHNHDNCCDAGHVNICGSHAAGMDETRCESFKEK